MPTRQHIRKVGAHSNQETRPCGVASPRSIVAPDSQPSPEGRRHRQKTLSSEDLDPQSRSINCSQPQPKRQRTSSYSSSNSSASSSWSSWDRAERSYWDSLSRLWLTPHALRELNRRNALLRTPPNEKITVSREQHSTDITHFARHGGPDLSDVRNVSNLRLIKYC